jgi:hypothetical protein
MKYIIAVLLAVVIAILESSLGAVRPFVYIPFTLFTATILFWLIEDEQVTLIYLGIGGLILDLMSTYWVATTYFAFFFSLMIVLFLNSAIDLTQEGRKFFAATITVSLSIISNYFLILLQHNQVDMFSIGFVLLSIIITSVLLGVVWVFIRSQLIKESSLYV